MAAVCFVHEVVVHLHRHPPLMLAGISVGTCEIFIFLCFPPGFPQAFPQHHSRMGRGGLQAAVAAHASKADGAVAGGCRGGTARRRAARGGGARVRRAAGVALAGRPDGGPARGQGRAGPHGLRHGAVHCRRLRQVPWGTLGWAGGPAGGWAGARAPSFQPHAKPRPPLPQVQRAQAAGRRSQRFKLLGFHEDAVPVLQGMGYDGRASLRIGVGGVGSDAGGVKFRFKGEKEEHVVPFRCCRAGPTHVTTHSDKTSGPITNREASLCRGWPQDLISYP
jgi:hypothetical protein